MRALLLFVATFFFSCEVLNAAQPPGIRLDPAGVSLIYPVFETGDWLLTQPDGSVRVTHFGDEYYAQDWARGCGLTHGHRLFAGISGFVVFAGARGPYGYTVVIYDRESGFALKYSHMSEISVAVGEAVLAGKSFIGRVGNTGNVSTAGCTANPGAHLHLALFKNVIDPNARPITLTSATSGSGPTAYAAFFGYASEFPLVRTYSDKTVYALYYGSAVPVSHSSFISNGWGFDKYQKVYNPVRVISDAEMYQWPKAHYFFSLRETALMKADTASVVYQFLDGRKGALSSQTFTCRGLRFSEIKQVFASERDRYAPLYDQESLGCVNPLKQTLADLMAYANSGLFVKPDWSGYGYYPDWSPEWELRWLRFIHKQSNQYVDLYRSSSIQNPSERYIGYFDPVIGNWVGWHAVR